MYVHCCKVAVVSHNVIFSNVFFFIYLLLRYYCNLLYYISPGNQEVVKRNAAFGEVFF